MLRSILVGALAVFMTAALPAYLMEPLQSPEDKDYLLIIETTEMLDSSREMVRLQTCGEIVSMPLEEYLLGVVIAEMPLSFHEEALKAQAVAARTFACKQISGGKHEDFDLCDQSSCCQAWNETENLRKKLGDSFELYMKKARDAVMDTNNQLLYYQGELIDAVYFSCSGGATEPAVAVWGSEIPYLQSVKSPGEEGSAKYQTSVSFSLEEFRSRLDRPDLTGDPESWFGREMRSEGGSIVEMDIGGIRYTGTDLRTLLGLNSTCFSVEPYQDKVVILVRGYGHRVGMSQYGANAMAEEGHTYEEILCHYYQGAEVK